MHRMFKNEKREINQGQVHKCNMLLKQWAHDWAPHTISAKIVTDEIRKSIPKPFRKKKKIRKFVTAVNNSKNIMSA